VVKESLVAKVDLAVKKDLVAVGMDEAVDMSF
jgi:hypothetical protein